MRDDNVLPGFRGTGAEMSMLALSNILAHRGSWNSDIPKNSREALSRALLAGYGLETDIRDLDGELVVSHDPPKTSDDITPFDWLLEFYVANRCTGVLALNIKSDGLAAMSKAALLRHGVSAYFVFDMSIPDTLWYLNADMPAYSRVSEYEPEPALADRCSGIWLDNFYRQLSSSGRGDQAPGSWQAYRHRLPGTTQTSAPSLLGIP